MTTLDPRAVDDMAALLWRTEAEDVGAPPSVPARRTSEAFHEQSDAVKDNWRKFARVALSQPHAGEPVAVGYIDPADTARKSSVGEPLRFWCSPVKTTCFSMPVYASPQPANPAQVTDATDEAVRLAGDILMSHGLNAPEQVIYRAARDVLETAAIGAGSPSSEAQIEHMVHRFLRWKLPDGFTPDGGIQFVKQTDYGHVFEPVGTNLFNYVQADAMVRHMIKGLPSAIGAGGQAVAVKPLEWAATKEIRRHLVEGTDVVEYVSKGEFRYTLTKNYQIGSSWDATRGQYTPINQGTCVSFEAAKAAAQADYERRIKSAIVGGDNDPR